MARIVCTIVLIAMLSVLVGCQPTGPDSARLMPTDTSRAPIVVPPAGMSEADLAEDMATHRKAYEDGLEVLIAYFNKTGNNMKLERARRELQAFRLMPKYTYVTEPVLLPEERKATNPVVAADDLYFSALEFEKGAGLIGPLRDENKLRLALQNYRKLIQDYPTSDKLDDAAYRAALILEEFKDYVTALDYYQCAYKWDPETIYPARFRAARILDKQMHRYGEAVKLYQEAVEIEARFDKYRQWKEYAQARIKDLQKLDESQG